MNNKENFRQTQPQSVMIIKNLLPQLTPSNPFRSSKRAHTAAEKQKQKKGAIPTPTPNREEFHSFQTTTSCKKFPPCQHPPTRTQIHVRVPKKPKPKEKKNKPKKKPCRFLNCTSRQPSHNISKHLTPSRKNNNNATIKKNM